MKLLSTTKEISRVIGGYLLTSTNFLPKRSCLVTLGSFDQNKRISGKSILKIASRSNPKPNAQPLYSEEFTPNLSKTLPFTTPLPKTSSHRPSFSISISRLGVVEGKTPSLKRYFTSPPKTARAILIRISCKSLVEIFCRSLGVRYQPSI